MTTRRALVTGIAGFIGSAVARRLTDEGWSVVGIDNLSTGRRSTLQECTDIGCQCIIDDYASEKSLRLIESGRFDVVFHIAAVPRVLYSVEHPVETEMNNALGTVKLLKACIGNVGRVVFSSSSSVLGGADVSYPTHEDNVRMPLSPYALQKATCEDYSRIFATLHGLDVVCLRYFNVFGPGQFGGSPYSTVISAWCSAIAAARRRNTRPIVRLDGDGEQTRDFCYITNVVDANVAAALSRDKFAGVPINIAHGEEHSINYVLDMMNKRVGDIDVVRQPTRPGDVRRTYADVSRAQALLDWTPKVSFDAGLDATFRWWGF